jgi:pre-mRNA cleavage complex 2 protein Pcf11
MLIIALQIYHATCYAEARASTSSLAAKLRTEVGHGSRSATPEVHPMTDVIATMRATPPPSSTLRGSHSRSTSLSPLRDAASVAGIKRKVEHSDSDMPQEATGTPPFKKVALSTPSS